MKTVQWFIRKNAGRMACVFGLVIACGCWPAAAATSYIITGETATGPVLVPFDGRPASNTVNDSGITINSLDLVTDGQITHGNSYLTMWTAGQNINIYGNPNAALGLQLTIDLQSPVYLIDGMRIWNYNGSGGGSDAGIHAYDIETSLDAVNWTLRINDQTIAQAPETVNYAGVYTAVNWYDVRYVRLTIEDTFRAFDDVGGLSEMMFSAQVPEPSSILLFGVAGLLMWWRRIQQK